MMSGWKRALIMIVAGAGGLSGCTANSGMETGSVVEEAIPERDIMAAAMATRGASILDVDKFKPTAPLSGCAIRAIPVAGDAMDARLVNAIRDARIYSEAQQGVGLMIVKDGQVIHESYAQGAAASSKTLSFSMMKSVTALAVGLALDKGAIDSIDTPVSQYLPEWKNDPRGSITLRQLLTMTSGLKLYSFSDPKGKTAPLMFSTDIGKIALSYPAQDEPGSIFRYNNANSQIVGTVIDRAVRARGYGGFTDFVKRYLWCPLGNAAAALWLDREGGSPHYYSGLHARLADWARIGEMIRNDGKVGDMQVISADWIQQMIAPSDKNQAYGLHVWRGSPWQKGRSYSPDNPMTALHSAPYKSDDVVFFDGFGGQRVYIVPSKRLTIARTGMVNMVYDDSQIVNLLLSAL